MNTVTGTLLPVDPQARAPDNGLAFFAGADVLSNSRLRSPGKRCLAQHEGRCWLPGVHALHLPFSFLLSYLVRHPPVTAR